MRSAFHPATVLLPLAAAFAAGCGSASSPDALRIPAGRPDLQRVLVLDPKENPDRFQKAAQEYRAYLAGHPGDAEGHLELGMLLADLEVPGEALFHLRLYEASGAQPGKEGLLQEYLRKCAPSGGTAAESSDEELIADLKEKNIRISELKRSMEELQSKNAELAAENEKLSKRNSELDRRLGMMLSGSSGAPARPTHSTALDTRVVSPSSSQDSHSAPISPGSSRGTWKVEHSTDTFESISRKIYGDATHAADIRKANPGKFDAATGKPRVGEVLVCP